MFSIGSLKKSYSLDCGIAVMVCGPPRRRNVKLCQKFPTSYVLQARRMAPTGAPASVQPGPAAIHINVGLTDPHGL